MGGSSYRAGFAARYFMGGKTAENGKKKRCRSPPYDRREYWNLTFDYRSARAIEVDIHVPASIARWAGSYMAYVILFNNNEL